MAIPVIAWIAINVGLYILNYAYRHFSKPDAVKPKPQTMRIPRAEENAVIPWFIGRVMVRSPLLVDKWGLRHEPVTQEFDGEDVVVGYRYVLGGVRFVLALGAGGLLPGVPGETRLHRVWFGDREVMSVGGTPEPPLSGSEDRPNFYGGNGQGGGISFTWHVYPGTFDQEHGDAQLVAVANSYEDARGSDALDRFPPLQGQVAIALLEFNTGEGGQLEPMRAEIQSSDPIASSGIFSLDLIGGADINPAVALWYVLTDPWGGLGIAESDIDESSFLAAGTVLAEEENGFSYIDESGGGAQERIDLIIAQTDGVLYQEPSTGKWTFVLIRDDYEVADLDLYDPSNIIGEPEYDPVGWIGLTNQLYVVYEDRAKGYAERTARDQSMSGIAREGGRLRTVTLPFPGCKTRKLASALASRELRKLSLPLGAVRLRVNRDGLEARPGSVIKWTWPEYLITEKVLRVVKVDSGSRDDNAITLHCVEDRFFYDHTVQEQPEWDPFPILPPYRIVERWVGEAPRWIQQRAFDQGAINDPDGARLFNFAVSRGGAALQGSFETLVSDDDGGSYASDGGVRRFPGRAVVETAYARTTDAYDTSVGLRITDLRGCTLQSCPSGVILLNGRNLAMVVGADGTEEVIAFETVTDEGGGVFTLSDVWRGLWTAPRDFVVGDRVYFMGSVNATTGEAQNVDVGRIGGTARAFEDEIAVSLRTLGDQHHENVEPFLNEHTIGLRALCPLPVADLELAGSKTPATLTEEGVDVTWKRRIRTSQTIVRGNIADQTPGESTTYMLRGWRGDRLVENEIVTGIDAATYADAHLGILGYGEIELAVRSRRTVTLPDGSSEALSSYQDPSLFIEAPEWRNLLLNPRGAGGVTTHWTLSGVGEITAQTSGTLGGAGYHFASAVTDRNVTMRQNAIVSGYWPERMRATAVFYGKNLGSDADDTLTVALSARDAADTAIGTQTYGPTAQSTSQWLKRTLTYTVLPADTHQLRVFATLAAQPGGDTNPQSAIAEYRLMVGQFTDDLIANGDFETGLTSWTSVAGTFTTPTTAPIYTGAQYAKGDAAADSEYRQDYAISGSVGYGVGSTAVLELARMNAHATLGTGTVTLECRDGSGVLASATTGAEHVGQTWVRRRLTVEVPVGTTTIRVRLISTRTSATASACFDDVELRLHKHLQPDVDDDRDLSIPDPRPAPVDADSWNRAYPDYRVPNYGLWDGDSIQGTLGREPTMEATSSAYAGAQLHGFWDDELDTNAISAIDIPAGRVRTGGNTTYANFRSADRFTVIVMGESAEVALAAARGLLGRMGTTGWSLSLDDQQDVVWASVVGATATGSTLTKTAALGWNAGAVSTQTIADGAAGHVEYTIPSQTNYAVVGLSNGNTNTDYTDVDFGLYTYPPTLTLYVMEGGAFISSTTYVTGDVVRVSVSAAGVVTYQKNGTTFYTSGATPTFPLLVDSALYSVGAVLPSVSIATGGVRARATLVGSAGTRSVPGAQVVAGYTAGTAPFVVAMSYDGTNVRVVDGEGAVATATSGMGEIRCDEQARFTLGRASTSETDFVGKLTRVYLWNVALDVNDIIAIVGDLGAGLPGGLQTYDRTGAGYYIAGADDGGDMVACGAEDRPVWGYATSSDASSGRAPGLVINDAVTNQIPTWDLTSASYTMVGEGIEVCPVRSPLGHIGQTDSVRFHGDIGEYLGIDVIPETGDTGTRVLSFWARADVAHDITVMVGSDASGEIGAETVSITTAWQRYDVTVAWDTTTALAYVQWSPSTDGTVREMDLAAPICFANIAGGAIPAVIPPPAAAVGATGATDTTTRSLQHLTEGEIIVEGCCTNDVPADTVVVKLWNGTNENDLRRLHIGGGVAGQPQFDHGNGTGTIVSSEAAAQSWSGAWTLRGRWARVGLLDAASAYAGVVFGDDLSAPSDYDVTSAFTVGSVAHDVLQVNDTGDGSGFNGVIRSIRVTSRETRLG